MKKGKAKPASPLGLSRHCLLNLCDLPFQMKDTNALVQSFKRFLADQDKRNIDTNISLWLIQPTIKSARLDHLTMSYFHFSKSTPKFFVNNSEKVGVIFTPRYLSLNYFESEM